MLTSRVREQTVRKEMKGKKKMKKYRQGIVGD